MKVLVTGAAGFIATHLIERLLTQGIEVVGIDDLNDYYSPQLKINNLDLNRRHSGFYFVQGDLRDADFMGAVFDKFNFDQVIHLAARAGVRPSLENPQLYVDANLMGTMMLLEKIRQQVQPCRLIFGSSSSVYGNQASVPFKETDACDQPVSPYAATKRAGELLCYNYSYLYQIPTACLRFFTVYGPRQRPEMAIAYFFKKLIANQPITVFGIGESSRDYTFVLDIVDGIVAAMNLKNLKYEIFNLGNSSPVTLNELLTKIEQITKLKFKKEFKSMQAGDVERTYADLKKSKQFLNYSPKVSLDEGLKLSWEWALGQ